MNTWINFKELREKLHFESVLRHFGVEVKRNGNQHKGPCPLPGHVGERKAPTFSAELERGIFRCFGCGRKGNVLEFAAMMRETDPEDGRAMRRIAIELQETFFGGGRAGQPKTKGSGHPRSVPETPAVRVVAVNPPLDFELKGLDHDHPYLQGLGITGETARFFGIGVADRGRLKGRLAIPLHDISGRLVGYAGRILDDRKIRDDNPKYVFPERRERNGAVHEFRKSDLVYNRSRIQSPIQDVIVVQSFMDLWWLHQCGFLNVVSIMGTECSERQAAIVAGILTAGGRAWIVPARESGERDSGDVLRTIASRCGCRWVSEFEDVRIPDLTAKEISDILKR